MWIGIITDEISKFLDDQDILKIIITMAIKKKNVQEEAVVQSINYMHRQRSDVRQQVKDIKLTVA